MRARGNPKFASIGKIQFCPHARTPERTRRCLQRSHHDEMSDSGAYYARTRFVRRGLKMQLTTVRAPRGTMLPQCDRVCVVCAFECNCLSGINARARTSHTQMNGRTTRTRMAINIYFPNVRPRKWATCGVVVVVVQVASTRSSAHQTIHTHMRTCTSIDKSACVQIALARSRTVGFGGASARERTIHSVCVCVYTCHIEART